MRQLDESRSYGKLLPSRGSAVYVQDGVYFDGLGRECADPDAPKQPIVPERPVQANPLPALPDNGADATTNAGPPDLAKMGWNEIRHLYRGVFGEGVTAGMKREDVEAMLREHYADA